MTEILSGDIKAVSASLWLFTIPFAMAIGLMLWGAHDEIQLLGISSGGFVLTVIFLLISLQMRRGKAKVYSTNSEALPISSLNGLG